MPSAQEGGCCLGPGSRSHGMSNIDSRDIQKHIVDGNILSNLSSHIEICQSRTIV